ncbi:MAG: pilus assembly protein [Chloroflexi bacterium]|nr:pilus assembly protein [Chloroflexota bacterium]
MAPILILLLLAIFQFAFVLESQMGLTNAVREAARRAAADPYPTSGLVQAQLDSLLATNIQGFDPSRVASETVTFCDYQVDAMTNYRVDVDVRYKHPVFFPLLAFATDFVDGTPGNGAWDLTAKAEMRLESGTVSSGTCVP